MRGALVALFFIAALGGCVVWSRDPADPPDCKITQCNDVPIRVWLEQLEVARAFQGKLLRESLQNHPRIVLVEKGNPESALALRAVVSEEVVHDSWRSWSQDQDWFWWLVPAVVYHWEARRISVSLFASRYKAESGTQVDCEEQRVVLYSSVLLPLAIFTLPWNTETDIHRGLFAKAIDTLSAGTGSRSGNCRYEERKNVSPVPSE